MSKIIISNLYFGFGNTILFNNISLSLDSSWKLGLIGRNGRGKTTLLKLIKGDYEYSGSIHSPLSFEYFPYDIKDKDALAIDALKSVYPDLEQWKLVREINLMGLDENLIYMPFNLLSSGQQTKLQLALMFSRENSFLLIDEPTNHLDSSGRKVVSKYLNSKQGFIVISHDRSFLDGCIDHVLSINKDNISLHKGNFSSWQREFDKKQQSEIEENKRLKTQIEKLSKAAEEKQRWSDKIEKTKKGSRASGLRPDRGHIGHMAAKMAKKSQVAIKHMERDMESKKQLLKNYESIPSLSISPQNCPFKRLVTLDNLSFSYGDRTVLNNINFTINPRERIAITGGNGCGKSTLLKLINGELKPTSGKLIKPNALRISYLPQDVSFLSGKLKDYIMSIGADETLFKTILRKLGFNRSCFETPLESFSQGQRKKAAIAASLCTKAHLYLWDEPLNYLDVISRIQLEELILSCKPSILLVEHDSAFIENVATRLLTLEKN